MALALDEMLMTEKELAEFLGLKPRTLQSWRLVGCGPKFIKLSNRIIRYRAGDVQEWMDAVKERQKQKLS